MQTAGGELQAGVDAQSSSPPGQDSGTGDAGSPVRFAAPVGRVSDVEGQPVDGRGLQWRVGRSAALILLGVALMVGAALFLVRSSEPSAAAISVELDADRSPGQESAGSGSGSKAGQSFPVAADGAPGEASDAAVSGPTTSDSGSALGPGPGTTGVEAAGGPPGEDGAGTIVVYVTGAVSTPGVVTTRSGTRLGEVLEDAGGALPDADLESINLASAPVDGQHVHVLAVGEEPRPELMEQGPVPRESTGGSHTGSPTGTDGIASGSGGAAAGIMDINTATLADLESLPRVGPVLGQRIIDYREDNGPFLQPADIDAVPGIGPAMLEAILPLIVAR